MEIFLQFFGKGLSEYQRPTNEKNCRFPNPITFLQLSGFSLCRQNSQVILTCLQTLQKTLSVISQAYVKFLSRCPPWLKAKETFEFITVFSISNNLFHASFLNSFMTEVPIIQKYRNQFINMKSKSMDWFLCARTSVMKELIC